MTRRDRRPPEDDFDISLQCSMCVVVVAAAAVVAVGGLGRDLDRRRRPDVALKSEEAATTTAAKHRRFVEKFENGEHRRDDDTGGDPLPVESTAENRGDASPAEAVEKTHFAAISFAGRPTETLEDIIKYFAE